MAKYKSSLTQFMSISCCFLLAFQSISSFAKELPTCASIQEAFGKEVRINVYDPKSQSEKMIEPLPSTLIPCGSVFDIGQNGGKIILKHVSGSLLSLAGGTYAQLLKTRHQGATALNHSGDLLVYRGKALIEMPAGAVHFSILTPSSRAQIQKGRALIVVNMADNQAQAVSLDGITQFSNRMGSDQVMSLNPGEESHLDFKIFRSIPTHPQAVSLSGLRNALASFLLTSTEESKILEVVTQGISKRIQEKIPEVVHDSENGSTEDGLRGMAKQAPAHKWSSSITEELLSKQKESYGYSEKELDPMERIALHERWIQKISGDDPLGESIFYPNHEQTTRGPKISIQTQELEHFGNRKKSFSIRVEEEQRRKLIEELKQITPD